MRASTAYHWITATPEQHRFVRAACEALGVSALHLWVESPVSRDSLTRAECGGLITATGICDGRTVAVVWSDFRVNAAAFGERNSRRFAAFLRELDQPEHRGAPLFYFVNSAGISLMEGRTVFSDAFALWPALLDFSQRHLLFTCADGRCLGLAPILFGLGHYRVAVTGSTQLNLTGPEVIRMFFGTRVDFAHSAAAERFNESTDLVHELVPSVRVACARFRGMLAATPSGALPQAAPAGSRTEKILASFLDAVPQELVPGWCDRVRVYLGTRQGKPIGVFINPPERANNMITVRTLDKYAAGLDLFRALGVPVVSFLDSPGFDPRFDQSAANNFRRMLWVGDKIIHYPHGCLGVVVGRCFGGAATLVFPKVFGGVSTLALRGSTVGIMDSRIVDRLLSGSPRLQQQWQDVASRQTPGLEDMVAEGSIDTVIELPDLPREVDRFLDRGVASSGTRRLEALPVLLRRAM